MSLFSRIFKEHATWLREKGYEETSLRSSEPNGTFEKNLKDQFEQCIKQNIWSSQPHRFTQDVTGSFAPKKIADILMTFQYEYDPTYPRLYLKNLRVRMGEGFRLFLVVNNNRGDLPSAENVMAQAYADHMRKAVDRLQQSGAAAIAKRGLHR